MSETICVLVPTLNEEESIGDVVERFRNLGLSNILVIDGHSTDRTREIAEKKGARVVVQKGKGKGNAIKQAFEMIDADVILMIDGDGTYLPEEYEKLVRPILDDEADHVIGNRFASPDKGAFSHLNLIGNRLLNFGFRLAFGEKIMDVLSGYRAFSKELIKEMELHRTGFEIEAELTAETLRRGFRIKEVPITYQARKGETKLRPLRDGMKIGLAMYDLVKMHNPMFYFGVMGLFLLLIGIISGVYVVIEWFKGISHFLLAILTALLIISGFQLLMFGVIGDLIVSIHRDLIRRRK
jgi:dolichol-phosphate mannosyltransferase